MVGSNDFGQIHPHRGINGCTYSGNIHNFREINPEEYYSDDDAQEGDDGQD
jgi:hypothetical protein